MLFNSIDFAIFLPIVFLLYWFATNHNLRLQNFLIVIASLIFYGWWDWRFLSLLMFSSLVDYTIGIGLSKEEDERKRKFLLWTSIIVNLGFLGFFKYYNFFLDNFVAAFSFFGHPIEIKSLSIILPVGISFYTFQTLSYSIDVYKRALKPTKDLVAFLAFVSFFPQLVAGPIERATNLLPQFYVKRTFDYHKVADGLRQILWGFFKKIVIADNCAEFANLIFNNSDDYSGFSLVLGAIFFTFQIYGDFSGYSDIAIGTSRLFGFTLMRNFAFPYFSRDVAEFWRRWHISLSTWFRDYLYFPLGGSQGSIMMKIRNTSIIFVVSGFWHGANWTFIAWGTLNALYFLPLLIANKNRANIDSVAQGKYLPSIKEFFQVLSTFSLTVFAWIFFRANNIDHAFNYIHQMFFGILQRPEDCLTAWQPYSKTIFLIIIFMIFEWFSREKQHVLQFDNLSFMYKIRWVVYVFIALLIFIYGNFNKTEFIYFAF